MLNPVRHLILLFCSALLASAATSELKLKNGDRVLGDIVSRSQGVLVFRSEIFGEIKVPEAQVASLTTSQPEANKPKGTKTVAGRAQSPDGKPSIKEALAGMSKWRRILHETKGNVELGFNEQTGRSNSSTLNLRADAEYAKDVDNYHMAWRYFYGRSYGILQADHRDGSFRWRHDLKNSFFVQAITQYADDGIKKIDVNLEQSLGLGLKAYDKHDQVLNLGGGSTLEYRKAFGFDQGSLVLGDLFEDYTWKVTERVSLKQDSSVQYSPVKRAGFTIINGQMLETNAEASNYRYHFNLALQTKISGNLSINLRYEYEYDNTIPVTTMRSDQRISTTLGYGF